MISAPPAATSPTGSRRDADWWLAVFATVAVLALHFYFLNRVGGLYRDEVCSVNLAQGEFKNITHDSFPVLFPLLLRGWNSLGLCSSDLAARSFGVLMGLGLTVAFWFAARWTRRASPLWSLALVALNAWVIYYSASLRAYGLGCAMIALCTAAAWRFTQNPGRNSWLLFTATTVLSVQTLYQNSVLVAGICAGAGAVAWRGKNFKLVFAVLLAGLVAAISLLPYYSNVAGMSQSAAPLRMDFDWRGALLHLDTLLAFPMPQCFWLWPALAGLVLVRAVIGVFSTKRNDLSLFAAVTMVTGAAAFWIFLWRANFPVQPWYFMPPVAVAAVCLEAALPRPTGKFRAALFGGLAAMIVISALFAVRLLDYRFTNVPQFAQKISAAAGKNDLVIVTPWQLGITFDRYFHGACEWMTVPPLVEHTAHRFDLIQLLMADPDVMTPVLEKISATLRAGGAIWVVGGINEVNGTNAPVPLPPPPLPGSGWNETPYRMTWNNQLAWLLRRNATNIECLDRGFAEDVNLNERAAFSKVTGWKN